MESTEHFVFVLKLFPLTVAVKAELGEVGHFVQLGDVLERTRARRRRRQLHRLTRKLL